MGADSKSRREHLNKVRKKTKQCPFCPLHSGENDTRKKPKCDKHKTKRKGR